jgi:creatinine amidohydrolase/Fe(II)-dependent formamide hydrolase-like protein
MRHPAILSAAKNLLFGCASIALLATATPIVAQKPPDTVLLEELTWDELRDLIKAGKTTAIIATAGTEQKGPHAVVGSHRFITEYTTEKIARSLGNAIVAPVLSYVPEGMWGDTTGHMSKPGTVTLPDERFSAVLTNAGKSLKAGGFTNIVLLGDHGGSQNGMRAVAAKLNEEWKGSGARAHFIDDYYAKSRSDAQKFLKSKLALSDSEAIAHAGVWDTSELLFVNPKLVRMDKRARNGGFPNSGVVNADPTKATAELGRALVQTKIDNAVAQIKKSIAAPLEKTP